MSTLFIGPSANNDTDVNRIFVERLAADADDIPFVPLNKDHEEGLLDGVWDGRRQFFANALPGMREGLELALTPEIQKIHVDLGNELATLFAAYYAVIDQDRPVSVTVHGAEHIGGTSKVMEFSPLLRRKLALIVLTRAEHVFVTSREDAAVLYRTYPRCQRELLGAPSKRAASPTVA